MFQLTQALETGASGISNSICVTGSSGPLRAPPHNPASHLPEAYRSCVGFPITPLIKGGPGAYLFLLLQDSMFASGTHQPAAPASS